MRKLGHTTKKQKLFQKILLKKVACKTQNLFLLLAFLLNTIALLRDVSTYCYLMKYRAKQKHLLQFHITNNELKQVTY